MDEFTLLTDRMPDLLPMRDRTQGLHVSGIIKDICIRMGLFADDGSTMNPAYMQIGKVFEYALILMLEADEPGRYIQPGEIEYDGVSLTPDIFDVEDWAIEEVKVAWMSSKWAPHDEKMWRYRTQLMAYCRAMDTDLGRLRILHIHGDWKGDEPKYHHWERRFTKRELDENWRLLKRHGERNRERLEEGSTERSTEE